MTLPAGEQTQDEAAPNILLSPSYADHLTGALWLHKDYVQVRNDWANEAHVSPPKAAEIMGDVGSWVSYVKEFGPGSFLTWSSKGLHGVLDYHDSDGAGRCQWTATYPFEPSPELAAWQRLANGAAQSQKAVIEALEDRSEDITIPAAADLMALLRALRATVTAKADTELRPDGSTKVQWTQEKTVKGGDAELPATIEIAIPILKGHDARYALPVRVRVSVDDLAHLAFRFSIPNAERALEAVWAERVAEAKTLLGDGFTILRAAG